MSFDMRDRLGLSVNDIGGRVSVGEAADLVEKLADTPGTWTHADIAGWSWPATYPELATITQAEWYMNVNRDTKVARQPITIPRPWSGREEKVDVTDEERANLRARLIATSPFTH